MSDLTVVNLERPITVVEGTVGRQGPRGPKGEDGVGSELEIAQIAQAEATELRYDMEALVLANLSI